MYNIYTLNVFFNFRSPSMSHPKNWAMHIFLIIDKIDAFFAVYCGFLFGRFVSRIKYSQNTGII